MRVEIRVVYEDGSEEVIQAGKPAALIAFADEFKKVAPDGPDVMREACWLAHHASGSELPFAEWLERVAEIDRPTIAGAPSENGEPTEDPTAATRTESESPV
jgi:hypothetical protein